MRFTDRRTTLEAWRVPKRGQDQKRPPMKIIVVRNAKPLQNAHPHSLAHPGAKCHSLARPDHLSFMFQEGGVGWGNNVHVPVHTQAQQPHHLSCCPADTGTALS